MNKVILIGRLTKDADLRATTTGTAVASFTLAVDRQFKAQNGTKETDFINCIAWRKQAENVAKYVHKGSKIAVEGRLQVRKYEKDGQARWITEVIADNITFLENKKQEVKEEVGDKQDPFLDFREELEASESIEEKLPF